MKLKKWLALLCAVALLAALATGCGGTSDKDDDDDKGGDNKVTGGETTTTTAVEESKPQPIQPLSAKKIGSISMNYFTTAEGGLYYKDSNGKYGIMTLDGKSDTGALYTDCSNCGAYFQVTTKTADEVKSVTDLNCYGLVDVTGKEIIPAQYASFKKLNEYFVQAIKVSKVTTNKDDALIAYSSDNSFAVFADDDDIYMEGSWDIYSVVSGQKIEGATGTKRYINVAYGKILEYVTDDGEKTVVNDKGEAAPVGAKVFKNNCYKVESDNTYTVYDSDHNKLFEGDQNGYAPYYDAGDYLLASKYENGEHSYVLLDKSGKQVSAVFTDDPSVYGDLLYVNEGLHTLDGKKFVDGQYGYVYDDAVFGKGLVLKQGEQYTCIDRTGAVLWEGADYTSYIGLLRQKEGDKYTYYSVAEQDYTIEGTGFANWLVQVSQANHKYGIVDVISGKPIIEGYAYYKSVHVDGVLYVYAQGANNTYDIYLVK